MLICTNTGIIMGYFTGTLNTFNKPKAGAGVVSMECVFVFLFCFCALNFLQLYIQLLDIWGISKKQFLLCSSSLI